MSPIPIGDVREPSARSEGYVSTVNLNYDERLDQAGFRYEIDFHKGG